MCTITIHWSLELHKKMTLPWIACEARTNSELEASNHNNLFSMVKISVRTTNGTVSELDITSDESLEFLKKSIAHLTSIPPNTQKLIYNGKLLTTEGVRPMDIDFKDGGIST